MNLFEYLGGRDPRSSDSGEAVLSVARRGDGTCISFDMAHSVASGLRIEIEASTTLQDSAPGGWEVIAARDGSGRWTGDAEVFVTPLEGAVDRVSVKPLPISDPDRFFRLRVQLVP